MINCSDRKNQAPSTKLQLGTNVTSSGVGKFVQKTNPVSPRGMSGGSGTINVTSSGVERSL